MTNPYYDPESLGLTKIAKHDLSEPNWSFDMLVAWRGPLGVYLATDSGCSCPTPFENYDSIESLTGPLTTEQALEEASSLKGTSLYDLDNFNSFIMAVRGSEIA